MFRCEKIDKKGKRLLPTIIAILLLLTVALGMSGCGRKTSEEGKLQVVAAIFPLYDWTREIIGADSKEIDLTLLVDNGMDLHSYQPSASDLIRIASCDVFLYVGGVSDSWIEDALQNETNPNRRVINLMEVLGSDAKAEEIVEGMQHSHEQDEDEHTTHSTEEHLQHEDGHTAHGEDEHTAHSEDESSHDAEHTAHEDGHTAHSEDELSHDAEHTAHEGGHNEATDEHVWLSIKNAMRFVQHIGEELAELAPSEAEVLRGNAAAYIERLSALDEEYRSTIQAAAKDTLLFCDRFPFRYLVDDYGLSYYAAFPGCSAETEASFATITFLTEKLDELKLSAVLTIEGSSQKIAETVLRNAKAKASAILCLDSLQSVNQDDIEAGISYLSVMKDNLSVLAQALQ